MKRIVIVLIHIFSAITIVFFFLLLKNYLNGNSVVDVLNENNYINSQDFLDKTEKNMLDVFEYINISKIFTKNDKLDEDSIIAYSLEASANNNYSWTLKYIFDRANYYGIYLNNNFDVVLNQATSYSENKLFTFYDKKYIDNFLPEAVFNQQQTEIDFIKEVFTVLGKYYKYDKHFKESNFKYLVRYYNDDYNYLYSNNNMSLDDMRMSDAFFYISNATNVIEFNIKNLNYNNVYNLLLNNNPLSNSNCYYCFVVDTSFKINDEYKKACSDFDTNRNTIIVFVITIGVLSIVFAFSLLFLLISFINGSIDCVVSKKNYFSFSFEIMGLFFIFLFIFLSCIISFALESKVFINTNIHQYYKYIYGLLVYIFLFVYIFFIFTQCERGYLNSDEYKKSLYGSISYGIKQLFLNLPVKWIYTTMIIPILFIVSAILIIIYNYIKYKLLILLIFVIFLICFVFVIFFYFSILNKAYNASLSSEMKSSNMRVDLITNISHDIRTPITSIITYADLLNQEIEKENINKSSIQNLSKVIIDKSKKLTKFLEDVLYFSKVSSGNIELNNISINLNTFIVQMIDNFKEQLKEKGIEIIAKPLKENIYIIADSDALYRIFDNLFSNIYKYALENSRVYINVINNMTSVSIEISNISKVKLTSSPDILLERFTKADLSRNSDGFGLGLSIVKDLVNNMKGTFEIKFDSDDLFIAIITFLKK